MSGRVMPGPSRHAGHRAVHGQVAEALADAPTLQAADARVRQRLVFAEGDVREPAWGPYRDQR